PGDFFQKNGSTDSLWINIRPDCDVVPRAGQSEPQLYLLKGRKVPPDKLEIDQYGQVRDRDNQFTVYPMFNGDAYCFRLKDLEIARWSAWKGWRKGRLLPPFSTRLQQKYAAYVQRTGLPTIPKVLRPSASVPAAAEVPSEPAPADRLGGPT
ncbi:MAG: hypothetical protein MUF13_11570, partial [Akkermansiaceae bacterium]|nr:hypothetical protein [Akkermansiaceae bacterium]